jgi:hypothetical protein
MTSASERTDDDVIVITEDDLVDQPGGAHAAPEPGDRELGDRDAVDEPADDLTALPYGTSAGETPAHETSDGGRGEESMATEDPVSGGRSAADPSAQLRSGPFAMPAGSPVDQPDGGPSAAADPIDRPEVASPAVVSSQPVSSELGSDQPVSSELGSDQLGSGQPVSSQPVSSEPVSSALGSGPITPGSGPISQPAASASASAAAGIAVRPDENWPEIQSMFVDDPRSAVERAAEVTRSALNALVAAAKDREQALSQNWQADGTGTEELRTSLQHYRDLANRLSRLSGEL